ncbi:MULTISPECIES: hypothetical protein [unclassified Synechocystis]|uniref:hypothetical protein n=1 Tax=unclassified Synechocystis TaxID=2640012 RepID=UPI00040B652E|nr:MULTISPECIES: hypothetical protein [unclassified Synechocystis]AIE74718.1 hypothetical protein D082_21900 [Synechocystis sp. PCC 6714]
MCVGCFVVSAFTLFMPATETPLPDGLSIDAMPPALEQTQAIAGPMAEQAELKQLQVAIGEMVAAFPANTEGQILKTKFAGLEQQLQAADDLDEANNILDEGFEEIKQKILASPQADALISLMYEIREAQFERLQVFAPTIPGRQNGWLS